MLRKRKWLIGFFIAAIFFFLNISLIPVYGLNWDEPTHYLRGQAFLRFFLTGKTDYSDLPTIQTHLPKSIFAGKKQADFEDDSIFRRSIYQTDQRGGGTQTFTYYASQPTGHPPLNGELAALTNFIFYQKLGIAGDIESYRLFTLFTSALLVFITFIFVAEIYGIFAGLVASIALISYPLFFAESHFNVKDTVSASFYTATLFSFYKAVETRRLRWVLISSIVAGFALGTKFNILFAPLTVAPWFAISLLKKKKILLKGIRIRYIAIILVCYLFVPLAMLIALWPALWQDPLGSVLKTLEYYRRIGYEITYQPQEYNMLFGINIYAMQWVFFATPLVTLFLSIVGIIYTLRRGVSEKYNTSFFFLFLFLVPILRVTLGGSIYGGLRQIMEFIPAMAILAGIGARYIVKQKTIQQFNNSTIETFLKVCVIFMFIPITFKLISIHPNQNAYFNPLIGGLKGAEEKNFPDWGVTLGSVYQQGIDWLNENAPKEANVSLVRGLHSNVPRIKLRGDINFDNRYYSGKKQEGEYIMEVIDYNWDLNVIEEKRKYLEQLKPVYAVKVDDIPILKIWKNEARYDSGTVVVAAGDIACGWDTKEGVCREWDTSELTRKINPKVILMLGDNQDETGRLDHFRGEHPFCQSTPPRCFGPTWGRFKDKIYPAPGNHEYSSGISSGYFDYFNGVGNFSGRAGDRDKGYYSFDLGTWHIIALNANCPYIGGCDMNSPQVRWLQEDLKKNKYQCAIAFWHNPRFSNGSNGDDVRYSDFWSVLYEAGVELVLNAHDHQYERFPRMDANSSLNPEKGIREFIVGTGGKNLTEIKIHEESRVINNTTFGVLKLTLYDGRYDWEFVPIKGQTFTDSGTGYCH